MSVEAIAAESSEESYFSDLDRGFFILADSLPDGSTVRKAVKKLTGPLHFDSSTAITQELAARTLVTLGLLYVSTLSLFYAASCATIPRALSLLPLAASKSILRKIGQFLQRDGFTHIRGEIPDRILHGEVEITEWDLQGNDFHYDGKFVHWTSRKETIIARLDKENGDDLVILHNVPDGLLESLYASLKHRYSRFYGYTEDQQLILSKVALDKFSYIKGSLATIELKEGPRIFSSYRNQLGSITQILEKEHSNNKRPTIQVYSDSLINHIELIPTRLDNHIFPSVKTRGVTLADTQKERCFSPDDRIQMNNDCTSKTIRWTK